MQCSKCGFENPEGMKFCGECGDPLKNLCPSCGFDNPHGFKFCGGCGISLLEATSTPINYTPAHLAQRIADEGEALETRAGPDGERKTITALFADIKGSMDLLETLDPEDARNIVDPALEIMMNAVHRYEGFVAQPTGDGIFALFGAPIAHEDHPQRALYAALLMQEEIKRYAEKLLLEKGINFLIRVGINTGDVLLRSIRKDDLHADYVPVGHSTSLAARMESLAAPGSIVVSDYTHRLTEGYFAFKSMGKAQIKGVSEPLEIYEVQGVGALRTRLQVAARRGLSRFVGRGDEMEGMKRSLELAESGKGQIVSVLGDPGVGKSRLFYEFRQVSGKGCLVLETFSISHGKAYPYLPLIDLLKNYFNVTPQDGERKRREKIGGKVLMLDRSLEDTLPYFFSLLEIEEEKDSLSQMDPQLKKKRTFDAIKSVLLRESLNQPLIIIFEDLHWLDGESQEFLNILVESVATAKLLLLVNYRPEYHHDWGSKTYYSQLRLDPLGKEEAVELLTALVGEEEDLAPLKRLILEKTEGNPFFMEEVVQTLSEEGILSGERGNYHIERSAEELHIPTTVQGVLASRIDRLESEEKEFLQTLSVMGKEFSFGILKRVVDRPEEELQRFLYRLQEGEFIYEQPAFPDPEYTFKHALTQEVSYNSLLEERRREVHGKTASAIEEIYNYNLEEHYSDLAHHYSRSGNAKKAVEYLGLAGEREVRRSANVEAIRHLTEALGFLNTLPETPKRDRQELDLQLNLGPALNVRYWGSPEVEKAYGRARELCEQLGETGKLSSALHGLASYHFTQLKFPLAREFAEQQLTASEKSQDSALILRAHQNFGAILGVMGELTSAQRHLQQGLDIYDPQKHRSLSYSYGSHPMISCLCFVSWFLWNMGYPDKARERIQEAMELARELSHPTSLLTTLWTNAYLYFWLKEEKIVEENSRAVIELSSEQGTPLFELWGRVFHGWVQTKRGQIEKGIAEIQQAIDTNLEAGSKNFNSANLAILADAYGEEDKIEEGIGVIDDALAFVEETEERYYESELYRLKGELLKASGSSSSSGSKKRSEVESEIEECFNKALEVARRQGAKSWELRAAMSMSRLWKELGKKEEARKLLGDVYNWFTEGFDTKDLKEAKALLKELG